MSELTITLSAEEANLVIQSLGIAEKKYRKISRSIHSDTIHVRNNPSIEEQETISEYYHIRANQLASLNTKLSNKIKK